MSEFRGSSAVAEPEKILVAAIGSLGAGPNGTAIVHAASNAAVDAARIVAFSAAGFILLGLIATLLLPRAPVAEKPQSFADDDGLSGQPS